MKKDISASDHLRRIYPEDGIHGEFSREVTFQVTENCNLACTYCYQGCKSGARMSWETGKKIVDWLYMMWDKNDPDGFINQNTKMIILDFIGGEPMLEVELIDKIVSYFWTIAIERRHPWAETFMISIATNGTQHFKPEVQKFIYKYKGHLSYGVSIDGPKEMHDACRVHHDGRGSFDEAYAAQQDYNKHFYTPSGTKATIARANLPYLSKLIRYYVEQGYDQVHANYVYEEDWNFEDANLLYNQMKDIADYILSLDHEVEIALFDDRYFAPMDEHDNNNWCGGTGAMLAFDPKGDAFPCIRYMNSSLNGSQVPLKIGSIDEGIYETDDAKQKREMLESITRRSQSTDECFYCPIASGCSWCFKAGTLISAPNGDIPIEQLKKDDLVFDADGNTQKVNYVIRRRAENTCIIETKNTKLFTTKEHPILSKNNKFVEADELNIGDIIINKDNIEEIIINKYYEDPYDVYNLNIDNTHTFTANNIKVHNCSGWNYQEFGTPNKRSTRICPMHKARSLANVYFWNKKHIKDNDKKYFFRNLPDDDALKIIDINELNLLNSLEKQAKELSK